MTKFGVLLSTSSVLIVVGIASCLWLKKPEKPFSKERPEMAEAQLRTVHTGWVTAVSKGSEIRLSAVTRSRERNRAAFAVPGRLGERRVNVGDTVKKGQILARLEPDTMLNLLDSARAGLSQFDTRVAQASRDLERSRTLARIGAVPSSTQENAGSAVAALEAGQRAARAQLNEAKRQLAQTTLRAPFDGVVSAVFVEQGEVVGAGTPIVALSSGNRVELEIDVPESLLGGLREGQSVHVDLPFLGLKNIDGRIETVGRVTAGYGRLFPVIVTLPEAEELRPGLTAEVVVPTAALPGMALPVAAVINPSGYRASVLRVTNGRVKRVFVETGTLVDSRVMVEGPLAVNDRVVVSGHAQLLDGEQVEVK